MDKVSILVLAVVNNAYFRLSGRKYRDEMRPRSGLLRGREFMMKDLYTFDKTEEASINTYKEVVDAYKRIFSRIGLPYVVVSKTETKGLVYHLNRQIA